MLVGHGDGDGVSFLLLCGKCQTMNPIVTQKLRKKRTCVVLLVS